MESCPWFCGGERGSSAERKTAAAAESLEEVQINPVLPFRDPLHLVQHKPAVWCSSTDSPTKLSLSITPLPLTLFLSLSLSHSVSSFTLFLAEGLCYTLTSSLPPILSSVPITLSQFHPATSSDPFGKALR